MTDRLAHLTVSPGSIWLLGAELSTQPAVTASWRESKLDIRRLRGRKMRTSDALMNEVAAALQFPSYFGENWPAFDECLSDMDWLPPSSGIVILIEEPGEVLAVEPVEALQALVSAVTNAARAYAEPVDDGEWWDRAAVPFHVVLQVPLNSETDWVARWKQAGAQVLRLENSPDSAA